MKYPIPPCFRGTLCTLPAGTPIMLYRPCESSPLYSSHAISDDQRAFGYKKGLVADVDVGTYWCTFSDYADWLTKACAMPWMRPVRSVKVEVTVYERDPNPKTLSSQYDLVCRDGFSVWFDATPIVEAGKKLKGGE